VVGGQKNRSTVEVICTPSVDSLTVNWKNNDEDVQPQGGTRSGKLPLICPHRRSALGVVGVPTTAWWRIVIKALIQQCLLCIIELCITRFSTCSRYVAVRGTMESKFCKPGARRGSRRGSERV
jgi:hypothetical protein